MAFQPLSQRSQPTVEYSELHEGVPSWLEATLIEFLRRTFRAHGVASVARARCRDAERILHFELGDATAEILVRTLLDQALANDAKMLDLLDFSLAYQEDPDALANLEQAMSDAGSAWSVRSDATTRPSLERRVDATILHAAQEVISAAGRAGVHLAEAWHSVYGRSPNPSHGYSESVRAIEAAAHPIVEPNNTTATLGTMIGALRATPSKWKCVLQPSRGDPITEIADMMQLVWTAQLDRHGTAVASAPLNVSLEEAQAAAHLAVTLVQWFTSGAVSVV